MEFEKIKFDKIYSLDRPIQRHLQLQIAYSSSRCGGSNKLSGPERGIKKKLLVRAKSISLYKEAGRSNMLAIWIPLTGRSLHKTVTVVNERGFCKGDVTAGNDLVY